LKIFRAPLFKGLPVIQEAFRYIFGDVLFSTRPDQPFCTQDLPDPIRRFVLLFGHYKKPKNNKPNNKLKNPKTNLTTNSKNPKTYDPIHSTATTTIQDLHLTYNKYNQLTTYTSSTYIHLKSLQVFTPSPLSHFLVTQLPNYPITQLPNTQLNTKHCTFSHSLHIFVNK